MPCSDTSYEENGILEYLSILYSALKDMQEIDILEFKLI